MNSAELRSHLERLDAALTAPARLCVYGSAAAMLLGQDDRTSLDVDVAGPYSEADETAIRAAANRIGLPVNPPEAYQGDHIEWVGAARLCLAPVDPATAVTLWQGRNLMLFTLPVPDLIASRLIRYDPIDLADIEYLAVQARVEFEAIAAAARRLPTPFRDDVLVQENLANLCRDMRRWS